MSKNIQSKNALVDASLIITEACVQAGADAFIGYPITPSNRFYAYGSKRFPFFLAGPDEISVMQWMSGLSSSGKYPVTATAFPGFALMMEGFNMAFMMELPMLIILTQRLGPSTGSATTGAQGDLGVIHGSISGGFQVPVFCPSNFDDAWHLTQRAIKTSIELRTPTILLTSKEMVMTQRNHDISKLVTEEIQKLGYDPSQLKNPYRPYEAEDESVPPLVPLGDKRNLTRYNASTHDFDGLIRKSNPESLQNTLRLKSKIEKPVDDYTLFEYDKDEHADKILVSYGISSDAARECVSHYREQGKSLSLLVMKTLLPVSTQILDIINKYHHTIIVEENIQGTYREILFGKSSPPNIHGVNKMGNLINPTEIIETIENIK